MYILMLNDFVTLFIYLLTEITHKAKQKRKRINKIKCKNKIK